MTTEPADLRPAPRRDNQDPDLFGQTPSQTVGPFFHYGLPWKGGADLVEASELGARPDLFGEEHYFLNLSAPTGRPEGEIVELVGRVLDEAGEPVPDAMLEIWQADAAGRYPSGGNGHDPHFVGFGRSSTDDAGEWRFRTIMPGRVPHPTGGLQAAHVAISIFGRGIVKRLATRLYFADGDGLADDPVLLSIPSERRDTMVARMDWDGAWRLDVRLRGGNETVFLDL